MPNWCFNTAEIKFPNEEAMQSFKADMHYNNAQEVAVTQALALVLATVAGVFDGRIQFQINNNTAISDRMTEQVISALARAGTDPKESFTILPSDGAEFISQLLANHNTVITNDVISNIDKAYTESGLSTLKFSDLAQSQRVVISTILSAASTDFTSDFDDLVVMLDRSDGFFDARTFAAQNLIQNVGGFNGLIFKAVERAYLDAVRSFGTKWVPIHKAEDCLEYDDEKLTAVLTFDTAWTPAIPVMQAIMSTYKASGDYVYYQLDEQYCGRIAFEKGNLVMNETGTPEFNEDIDSEDFGAALSPDYLVNALYEEEEEDE